MFYGSKWEIASNAEKKLLGFFRFLLLPKQSFRATKRGKTLINTYERFQIKLQFRVFTMFLTNF